MLSQRKILLYGNNTGISYKRFDCINISIDQLAECNYFLLFVIIADR
ncbi:hypothetical protein GPAL_2217 [Glaciecola pallidula DSM 14239 = ACAM 615]|uniref:Uncharacterized protein n=1 Tax=Brumicola pallidula DSM 14239 = ACAM 615 TaxID=1121922 RepID=K6ZJL8_9ALTE|nr:hypothetical protein GPAL_2217 [Glaciecola pallidula DSM 14239 = ACAM 615]